MSTGNPPQGALFGYIDAVAKERGLIYVFDLSQGNPVYTSAESLDMLPLVKAKLGIK